MSGCACSIAAKAVWALSGTQSAACSATTWILAFSLTPSLKPFSRSTAGVELGRPCSTATSPPSGSKRLGGVFAGLQGDLVVVAADEGRVVLAGIADRLAVELDHRDAGIHGALHRRRQRRRLEGRDQQQVDLLGDEIVDLRGLRVDVAGAVGDLQRELRHFLGGRGQLVIDVLAIGLGIVGLRKADDELAVLRAGLDQRVGGLGGAGDAQGTSRRAARPASATP